jgi:hypothetical protein
MLQAGKSRVRFPMSLGFSINLILPDAYSHDVDSTSNRNEYQESSWGKRRAASEAGNLTAICEPTV